MTGYDIASAVLTAVSLGYRVEALMTELEARRAAGATDAEILAYFRGLAQKALDAAQAAIDAQTKGHPDA